MDYEHLHRRAENASMNEAIRIDYQSAHAHFSEIEVREKLRIFGLANFAGKWKLDLKILNQLLPSEANVYELKHRRLKDSSEHYSTVLRALRRLERKKFVRLVSSNKEGRRNKTYACTLLGELVVALARKGLKAAGHIIAESSPSFRECLRIHSTYHPSYWEHLTLETIEGILKSKGEDAVTRSNIDLYVRNAEFNWARNHIIEELNNISSRPNIRRYLGKIPNINWLSEWLAQTLEKHVEKESEWLQTLRDCARVLLRG